MIIDVHVHRFQRFATGAPKGWEKEPERQDILVQQGAVLFGTL